MDGAGDSNNNDCESSQSSEEPSDLFRTSTMHESSVTDSNAWLHLKTITTFESGLSSSKSTSEQQQEHNRNHDNYESFDQHEKVVRCFTQTVDCPEVQRELFYKRNDENEFSEVPKKVPLPTTAEKSQSMPRNQRRRRSQSNSLSEGQIPLGAVADPVSHFSISSSPPRNGAMSDLGVDRTQNSLGSISPTSVQSLTRFSPRSLLVESLIDQLCKLMETDTGKQKKLYHVICERLHQMHLIDDTYTIEEFQFLRSHYQKALYQLLAVSKSSTQSTGSRNILLPLPSPSVNVDFKISSEQIWEWSRYQHEYQELEYIAKGGFGHVYKVRNKLDGGEYAIKKIYLRYRYIEEFHSSLKEVKMLARLNHPNIVSYKAAWLEPLEKSQKSYVQKPSSSSTSQEVSLPNFSVNLETRLPLPPAPVKMLEDSLDVVFQDSSPDNKSICSHSPEANNIPSKCCEPISSKPTSNGSISGNSSSIETNSSSSSSEGAVCPVEPKKISSILQNWATLYVQMQLCERTLRQWLDERNAALPAYPLARSSPEGEMVLNLFRKIVRGVDYIHNKGIVHHDIKPSNIFVNETLKEVQVGDFGLSCCILSRVDSTGVVGEHHGEVGTRMYAAPEQLGGQCNSKSDVYSLGILFLELLQPFHTDMERSKVIQKLKTGQVPPELSTVWPHAARLISDLLTMSPAARPTASELLKRVDALLRSNMENDISSLLTSKDETIRLLKEAVASRDQEIAELRRRLSVFEEE